MSWAKAFYTCRDLFIQNKPVEIKRHAFIKAFQRRIPPDLVYSAICTGKQERFGKNLIRIVKTGRKRSIVCIGEDTGQKIIIKTIEWGN